jgi:hypothetical protein
MKFTGDIPAILAFPIFQQTIKRQIAKEIHTSHIYVFKLGFESVKQEHVL